MTEDFRLYQSNHTPLLERHSGAVTTLKHTPPPVTTNHLQSQKVDCGCEPGWVMRSDLLFPLIYESIHPQKIKTHKYQLFKGIFHPKMNSVIIYSPSYYISPSYHPQTTYSNNIGPHWFSLYGQKRDLFQNIFFCAPQNKIVIPFHFYTVSMSQCATIQKSATKAFSNISHQIHPSSNDLRRAITWTPIARLLCSNNKCLICFWIYLSS